MNKSIFCNLIKYGLKLEFKTITVVIHKVGVFYRLCSLLKTQHRWCVLLCAVTKWLVDSMTSGTMPATTTLKILLTKTKIPFSN